MNNKGYAGAGQSCCGKCEPGCGRCSRRASRYDVADRMTGTTGPGTAAPVSYTYDANGNQLSAGSTTFAYDLADRLKEIENW